ncbi:MAG: arginine deiminase [Oscillospiraceae bacterium]|jgi:arginine deiminase|nr:arginine deiminase [Oscillospiraceae bacterium]MDE6955777.1 arginine deiminase [Oscillospiraceae bacterium]
MKGICVRSEINPLKKVLLHRPGRELLNLTPDTLGELLFDDIPFLRVAQEEHDAFAQILRDNGTEVVYLEDLMTDVLSLNPKLVEPFLRQWLYEGNIKTRRWQDKCLEYLTSHFKGKALVEKTMEGITLKEMGDAARAYSLQDLVAPPDDLVVHPMPNLYFTRDPFASVGTGVFLHKMYSVTRCRETIYADYIFKYHPDFEGLVTRYYDRDLHANIEGGDVLNLTEDTLAIGISQRTCPDAIEAAARNLFSDPEAKIRTVLAFDIPKSRAFMHLDTVFTQIDVNKYTVHPAILGPLTVYEITPGKDDPADLHIKRVDSDLKHILETYTHVDDVQLIYCGGDDLIAAAREQWNDGSNTLCIAPGKIVVYQRNDVSNAILRDAGLTVLEMPSAELSRGRGGPRCMSMPLIRAE